MLESTKTNREKSTRRKGAEGEDLAEEYLIQQGYEIIKRNFTFGKVGEIDIVAKDKNEIVFVEVKTKTKDEYGDPLDRITPQKQKKLKIVAKGYFYVNGIYEHDCRFDAITIDLTHGKKEINHIKYAL